MGKMEQLSNLQHLIGTLKEFTNFPSWNELGITAGFAVTIVPTVKPSVVPAPSCCIIWPDEDCK